VSTRGIHSIIKIKNELEAAQNKGKGQKQTTQTSKKCRK